MRVIVRTAIFLPAAFTAFIIYSTSSFADTHGIEESIFIAADVDTITVLVAGGNAIINSLFPY